MLKLEEVLEFVRTTTPETRNLIIRELQATRRCEDEIAAKSFRLRELVRFHYPDHRSQPLEGRIGRIRVILAVANESGVFGASQCSGEHGGEGRVTPRVVIRLDRIRWISSAPTGKELPVIAGFRNG